MNLFEFHIPAMELIVRGTLVFWFLFLLFRFVLHRNPGSLGIADILLVVLIADAAQNGMAGEYKSVGGSFVLVGTLAAWSYFIDWMEYRFRWFARLSEPGVVTLVRHGKVFKANLRREMLTESALDSQLREQGVDDLALVKYAALEPNGKISVVLYSK